MEKDNVGNKEMDKRVNYLQRIISDKYLVILLGILLICPFIFLKPSIHGNDGILNYVYVRSYFFDRDFDFTNENIQFDKIKNYDYKFVNLPKSPTTGHPINRYGIGSSILWSPFFVVAHIITKTAYSLHISNTLPDGYTYPYVVAISIGSVFYASIGLLLLYLLCRELFKNKYSFYAVIAILFCSPLFFYIYFHPSMSHANSFFIICALLYVLNKFKRHDTTLLYILLGILCGFIVTTRFQDIPFLAVPPIFFLSQIIYSKNKNTQKKLACISVYWRLKYKKIILCIIAFFVALFPQMYVWHYLYGSYTAGPMPYLQYNDFSLVKPVHFFQIFFSPLHGLFFWHPLLIIGVIGLFIGVGDRKVNKWLIKAGIVGFLLDTYLLSCWQVWWGGASFGNRMFISSLPIFAFGFANIFERFKNKINEGIIILIITLFTLLNFGLMYQYGKNMIPRENYVSYKEIILNFVKLIKEKI